MTKPWLLALLVAGLALQAAEDVNGAAILAHPLGQLAIQSAELISAGKIDEYMTLRIGSDQDDWKAATPDERARATSEFKRRTPSVAVLTEAIRQTGRLIVRRSEATLSADAPPGEILVYYERELNGWRIASGPAFAR